MASKVVMPDQSKRDAVAAIFFSNGNQATWRLFKNQVWVDDDTILTDLEEADYDGYAPITLPMSTSLAPGPAGVDGNTAVTGPYLLTFPACTGEDGNQVYGAYVTYVGSDTNTYLWQGSNCFDDEAGIDVDPPVGVLIDFDNPPPFLVWQSYLWDYFQPTP